MAPAAAGTFTNRGRLSIFRTDDSEPSVVGSDTVSPEHNPANVADAQSSPPGFRIGLDFASSWSSHRYVALAP
jgi:hypothetical protein